MKKSNNKIPLILSSGLVVTGFVINPVITTMLLATIPTTFYIGNKIVYKNKNSELFKIDKSNHITQAIGINILKSPFIKSKSDYFKTELINLLMDLNQDEVYKTESQSLVLRSLKILEDKNFIRNLEYTEMTYKNKLSENINNFFVNIGTGNYSRLFKGSKKYNINFTRTDKTINSALVSTFLESNYKPVIEEGKIQKLKYSYEAEFEKENLEHLDFLPPSKFDDKRKKLNEIKSDLQNIKNINSENQITNEVDKENNTIQR